MKRRVFRPLGWLLVLVLVLCGCGRTPSADTSLPASPAASVSDVEPEPDPDPFADAPLGILGLDLEQKPLGGDVTRIAHISRDARCAQGYIWFQDLYDLKGDLALVSITLSGTERPLYRGEFDESYDGEGDYEAEPDQAEPQDQDSAPDNNILALFDLSTGRIVRKVSYTQAPDSFTYLSRTFNQIWLWDESDGVQTATQFDRDLKQTGQITMGSAEYGFPARDNCYYTLLSQRLIYRYTPDGQPAQQVTLGRQFSPDSISGIFPGEDGHSCLLASGVCGDLRSYRTVIYDLDLDDYIYRDLNSGDLSFYVDNGALICSNIWNDDTTVVLGGKPWTYHTDYEYYCDLRVLDDGRLLFNYLETDDSGASTFHLDLYDGASGTRIAATSFPCDLTFPGLNGAFTPSENEDALILQLGGSDGSISVLRWDLSAGSDAEGFITAEPSSLFDAPVEDIDDFADLSRYVPGECPAELSDLRARADEMEERFGFQIHITDECRNIIGGYAIDSLTDRDEVASALDTLEYEASKYPDGFFSQFVSDYSNGLDIYLASTLTGTDPGTLGFAGGFQTIYDGYDLLVIDATYYDSVDNTFHHELSHAIDTQINTSGLGIDLDGEDWQSLNPDEATYGDSYTYSYDQFGEEDMMQFAYFMSYDSDNAYFIDDYSMTFPTEDRARLFEYAMIDDDSWIEHIDWENCPHLRVKLNYFAQQIRRCFDSDGWGPQRWERFGSEEASS